MIPPKQPRAKTYRLHTEVKKFRRCLEKSMKSFFDGESILTLERRAAVDDNHGDEDTSFVGDEDVDAVGRFGLRANNAGFCVDDEVDVVCNLSVLVTVEKH